MHLYHNGSPVLSVTRCTSRIKQCTFTIFLWLKECFGSLFVFSQVYFWRRLIQVVNVAPTETDPAGNIIFSKGTRAGKCVYLMPLMRKKDKIWINSASREHLSLSCRPPLSSFFLPFPRHSAGLIYVKPCLPRLCATASPVRRRDSCKLSSPPRLPLAQIEPQSKDRHRGRG